MCFSALVRARLEELEQELGARVSGKLWSQLYEVHRTDPGKIKFVTEEDNRLFPGVLGPVICRGEDGGLWVEPMNYSAFVPPGMTGRSYTSYNARRDNLHSPFWQDVVGKGHGLVLITAFFEWVAVKDLLKAGIVSLEDVRTRFNELAEARREKVLASGKKYKPSKTESTDPLQRNIVIEFRPQEVAQLWVPVIFNRDPAGKNPFRGFAIITDLPPREVREAGHDRCPVFLTKEYALRWLQPEGMSLKDLDAILESKTEPVLRHRLDDAI